MASSTQTVVRYTALIAGIFYGIVHQSTLQTRYDESSAVAQQHHREELIEKARAAWAKKQAEEKAGLGAKKGAGLITDPEDPKFDLEALVNSWAKASA